MGYCGSVFSSNTTLDTILWCLTTDNALVRLFNERTTTWEWLLLGLFAVVGIWMAARLATLHERWRASAAQYQIVLSFAQRHRIKLPKGVNLHQLNAIATDSTLLREDPAEQLRRFCTVIEDFKKRRNRTLAVTATVVVFVLLPVMTFF